MADPVEEWANALGVTFGFREVTHTFELFGLCDRCADPDSGRDIQGYPGRSSFSRDQPAASSFGEDDG